MNKLFKGAIASAAGISLLMGGAGTFALWQDDTSLGSSAVITAGELRFGATPEEMPRAAWTLNGQDGLDIEDILLVPGDELLTTFADVPVYAKGTHLAAQFGIDLENLVDGTAGHTLAFMNALDYTVSVDGYAPSEGEASVAVPIHDGMNYFDVVVAIYFDRESDDTGAYAGTVTLQNLALTITQVPHEFHEQTS